MKLVQTAERSSHLDRSENVMVQRFQFAYKEALAHVKGSVLEIGSGEGYGMKRLAPKADRYIAIDKYPTNINPELKAKYHIDFFRMKVPPLHGIEDKSIDMVVSFQVIEHIKNDDFFIKEIYRVLKPGAKLILTTPNIRMSLTRNPWHIREYTLDGLKELLLKYFPHVDMRGVFGNEKIMDYYYKNKESIKRYTRFDILNMQYWMPRFLLRIPYDVLNRLNRYYLLKKNNEQVKCTGLKDFYIGDATEECFDILAIAVK
jgi:SAM-dependent methyltransferase